MQHKTVLYTNIEDLVCHNLPFRSFIWLTSNSLATLLIGNDRKFRFGRIIWSERQQVSVLYKKLSASSLISAFNSNALPVETSSLDGCNGCNWGIGVGSGGSLLDWGILLDGGCNGCYSWGNIRQVCGFDMNISFSSNIFMNIRNCLRPSFSILIKSSSRHG